MVDYSFVKDENENVCGFWFRNPDLILKDAVRQGRARHALLRAAAIKHSLPEDVYAAIFMGDYRIVANNQDDKGGCFVLLGTIPRPGEVVLGKVLGGLLPEPQNKWYQFWK